MKYYKRTAYPEIYKDSNWGNRNDIYIECDKSIYDNRNEFIKNHGIVKYESLTRSEWTKQISYLADHNETYRDKWGRKVMVYSCYSKIPNPYYTTIKPMFGLDQISGYRKIETRMSKTILMKQVFDKIPEEVVKYIKTFIQRSSKYS